MKKFNLLIFIFLLLIASSCVHQERSYWDAYPNGTDKVSENIDTNAVMKAIYVNQSKFDYEIDDFSYNIWVSYKDAIPKWRNKNATYTYFGVKDKIVANQFHFVLQYVAHYWLFIENLIFDIDGKIYYADVRPARDNGDLIVWEWIDVVVGNDARTINEKIISAIANASLVKIKIIGDSSFVIRELSPYEIQAIGETYRFYKSLGGQF